MVYIEKTFFLAGEKHTGRKHSCQPYFTLFLFKLDLCDNIATSRTDEMAKSRTGKCGGRLSPFLLISKGKKAEGKGRHQSNNTQSLQSLSDRNYFL